MKKRKKISQWSVLEEKVIGILVSLREGSGLMSIRKVKTVLFINTQQENAVLKTRVCLLNKHQKCLLLVGC